MANPRSIDKIIASTLSILVFLTNGALASAPEQNFWAARQGARAAALPREMAPITLPPRAVAERITTDQSPEGFVRRILPAFASVREIVRPQGRASGDVVVLIQDIHQNSEAQNHVSALVRHLADGSDRLLVGLEGAFSPLDLQRAHAFNDQAALKTAADFLLRENRISGAVHGALISSVSDLRVSGIDDENLYWTHVSAYRASVPLRATFDRRLSQASVALAGQRQSLSSALQQRLSLAESHRSGEIALPVYVSRLLDLRPVADKGRLPPNLPEISKLMEAYRLESSLDFARAEVERTAILRRLAATIPPADARRLIDLGAAYKLGRLTHREFFSALADMLAANGISLSQAPLFVTYLRYVALVDGLSPEKMFSELTRLEKALLTEAKATPEERSILDFSERVGLLRRLRDQALTPDDWRRYLDLKSETATLAAFLPDEKTLAPFEAFYQVAEARDAALARNLLARMRLEKRRSAVVIAGGFHARGVTERLAAAGVTVISTVPNITKVPTTESTAYLSYFAREKTPLDQLFEGRRLYLPTPPAQLGALGALTALAQEAADPARRVERPGDVISAIDGRPAASATSEDLPDGSAAVTIPEGRFVGSRFLASVRFTASMAGRMALRPLSIVHPLAVVMFQRAMTSYSSQHSRQVLIMAAFLAYMVIAGPYVETEFLSFLTSTMGSGLVAAVLFIGAHAIGIVITRLLVKRFYYGRAVVPISVIGDLRNPTSLALFLVGSALVAVPFLWGTSAAAFWISFSIHAVMNATYLYNARLLTGDDHTQAPLTSEQQISTGLSIARLTGRLIEDLQEQTGKDIDHPKRLLVRTLMDLQWRARAPYERWIKNALRKHEAVRVLQLNMLEKPEASRWQLQKAQFAQLVHRGRPHIVTLQEVTPGDEGSTAAELARANGYAVHEWEPRASRDRGVPAMAILYDPSFELEEAWEQKVSGAGVLLGVRLRSKETGLVLHVATCRLSYHPINDRDTREYQRQLINEEMSKRAMPGDSVVITGDFNPATEEEITQGMTQFPGFSDTFRATDPIARGVTFSMGNSFTKNYSRGPTAGLPSSKRLDLVISNRTPIDASLEFNERPFSSDHFGLLADIGITAPALAVAPVETLTADTLAEARRLVAAGVLVPGDAVLLYEAWGAANGWTAEQVEKSVSAFFPLLAPRLGVDADRWNNYSSPTRREPFETSVWYNNMRAPMEKRLRSRWEALFTAHVTVAGGKEILLPDYLLERAREAARTRYPRLEKFVPYLGALLRARSARYYTMENVRLVVHGSFLYGDKPNDLDIDVYLEGTSLTRELLAGQKANVRFDSQYAMPSLPLHASAFGLARDPDTPSVNDAFLTTAFWNGLPVWGNAEPEAPGVMDRLRSIEEYLGFIEVKRHENRFDKTKGYLIGFLYFLLAQTKDQTMKGDIGRELDALENPAAPPVDAANADRIIALSRKYFDQLVRASVDKEGYAINFEYKGGYLGVASVYLRTAREKIQRTVYRNLGAWALMRTAIVLYLAVRQTDPTLPPDPLEETLLSLSSELDMLRKTPFTPSVRARVLEIEKFLTSIQRLMSETARTTLDAQEKEARAQFDLETADAQRTMSEKLRQLQQKREHLAGRKLREADANPAPPTQTKVAPNAAVAAILFSIGWLAFLVGIDPSPWSSLVLIVSPVISAILFLIYGRALQGAVGSSLAAPSTAAIARWLQQRFGLTVVWVSEDDWLSGAMTSPYAEIKGSTIFIRERASRNLLALALLIAHEAHGERPLSGGPAWLFTSSTGKFVRESIATIAEFIFFLPVLISLRNLPLATATSQPDVQIERRLAEAADDIIALGRARAAGTILDDALPGPAVATWDIGGPVAGTRPAGPLTVGMLEHLPGVIARRIDAQVTTGALPAADAPAVRAAIAGWLGQSVAVDGKTYEFVARRSDLTDTVLNRFASRRQSGLNDTIYVDAAEQAADPAFYDGLRRRGLNVSAVAGLINLDRKEIQLTALGDVIRGWDDARRKNSILTFSGELSFTTDGDAALAILVKGVSVATIESLIAAIESGLRSVVVVPMDVLIQASRITAMQA